jgi:hypothetical protein
LPPDQTTDIILPLSRVRKTAKMDADVRAINHDGVAVIAKVILLANAAPDTAQHFFINSLQQIRLS